MTPRVGIVVPTLGTRPAYLKECLESIRAAGDAYIILVGPSDLESQPFLNLGLVDEFLEDPKSGLAGAINAGMSRMPDSVEYVNWLGDDDLLYSHSLDKATKALDESPSATMVFGQCDYIDSNGNYIWTNRSGPWAEPLLRVGPDLIPQPGALFRKSSFFSAGALDTSLLWAFDFDLFIKLSKQGRVLYLDSKLAKFRWHPESLSVAQRRLAISEASNVRVSHLPRAFRPAAFLWEIPVRTATLLAGTILGIRSKRRAQPK